MNIQFHKTSPLEGNITIHLSQEDYQPSIVKKTKEYSKTVKIKGFRPGSVPIPIIQKMYGTIIVEEVINSILSKALHNFLQTEKLAILGKPLPLQGQKEIHQLAKGHQKEPEFTYQVGLAATIDLSPINKDIKLCSYTVHEIEERVVNTFIEKLQYKYSEIVSREKSSQEDTLFGLLENKEQGISTLLRIPIYNLKGEAQQSLIDLSSGSLVAIKGAILKYGSNTTFGVTMDMYQKILACPNDTFDFNVQKVGHMVLPTIAPPFFDQIFGKGVVADEATFTEKIKQIIVKDKQQEADDLLDIELQDFLLQKIAIPLPDEFLKKLLRDKHRKVSSTEIDTYYNEYKTELRWDLLLNQVLQAHDIKISPQDIINYTKEAFRVLDIASNKNEIDQEQYEEKLTQTVMQFFKNDTSNKNYKYYYERLSTHKALDCIKKKITIENKIISISDLQAKRAVCS